MPQIQRASASHAAEVAALLRVAFQEYRALYTPGGFEATTPSAVAVARRLEEGPTWIAVEGSTVVGTVSATLHNDELRIRSMAVLPEARGRGIARQLLATVEAHARALGVRRLTLSTTPFLADAIRLYERSGFREMGVQDLCGTPLIDMVRQIPNGQCI